MTFTTTIGSDGTMAGMWIVGEDMLRGTNRVTAKHGPERLP